MSAEIPTWETEMREIASGVYAYIQAKGTWFLSNAGLIVGREEAIVVDSLANSIMTNSFLDEVKKVSAVPIHYLINTHHHEHVFTNHLFPGAKAICQAQCRESTIAQGAFMEFYPSVFPDIDLTGAKTTPQDITYEKQFTLYLDDREIRLIHDKPAHTRGDTFAYLPKEGVIFAGDLLFFYSTPLALEGYIAGWIETLDLMINLGAKTYVPGHGPVCGIEGPEACREYLVLIHNEARKRFEAGMESYDAAKDIDLSRFRRWANPERIIVNVERAYHEFRGEEPACELNAIDLIGKMKEFAK
jgi:glyoxylase-like metal-dependent hydrolase (beta-lactamase superfamily II)